MEKMVARIDGLNTEDLKTMAMELMGNFEDGADMVQGAILDILSSRIPEADFVAFCDGL